MGRICLGICKDCRSESAINPLYVAASSAVCVLTVDFFLLT